MPTGFSQKIALPASAASSMYSVWNSVVLATITASIASLVIAAWASVASAPRRSASAVARGTSGSAMVTSWAPGRPATVAAWMPPMRPAPITQTSRVMERLLERAVPNSAGSVATSVSVG